MVKKIFRVFYYILIPVLIFVLMGLAIESNNLLVCNSINVNVDRSCGNYFIEPAEINQEVYTKFDTTGGNYLNRQSLNKIENFITGMTYVRDADVYRTINGKLHTDITQRRPLIRVVNASGQSFYIDTDGRLMPLSSDYTARVMVVSGSINSQYSPLVDLNQLSEEELNEQEYSVMKDIFKLAEYIDNHSLLNVFIGQMYVCSDKKFKLIPKNGSHIIEFGSIDRMEQKFNKLWVFYNYGLTQTGWNKYSRINLKYKNQVVCAK